MLYAELPNLIHTITSYRTENIIFLYRILEYYNRHIIAELHELYTVSRLTVTEHWPLVQPIRQQCHCEVTISRIMVSGSFRKRKEAVEKYG
jgi:hypothetical protein